jgi:hypothetical protein
MPTNAAARPPVACNAPCPCGSGRKFKLCHGQTREREWAHRRQQEGLDEALDYGGLFPELRPRGLRVLRAAEELAASLGDDDEVTDELRPVVELMDERDARAVVATYADAHPGPWADLCAEIGDTEDAEGALVIGAVEERRPRPRSLLELIEAQRELEGRAALAFELPAPFVWAVRDAELAGRSLEVFEDAEPMDVVGLVADRLIDADVVRRLRWHAARLAGQLPATGLPRASRMLAEACEQVAHDEEYAHDVAALMLAEYLVFLGAVE